MEQPYDNYFVHFDINPAYLQLYFITDLFPDGKRKAKIGIDSKLLELYRELIEEMTNKETRYMPVCSSLFLIIMVNTARKIHERINKIHLNPIKKKGFSDHIYIDKAQSYILENYNRCTSVKDICAHLSISESYLFQLFKNHLDITPGKYITYTRMKKAEHVLKNSNKSIKEIASFIGYEDPLYFTK